MSWMSLVAAGLQAVSSIQQGKFQQAQYNLQARQSLLKGRREAIAYSEQGLAELQKYEKAAGAMVAGAAAGGVNPFTGSAMTLNEMDAVKAGKEYNRGLENADLAIAGSVAQSQALRAAGKQAMKSAYMNAAISVAAGVASYASAAPGPSSKGLTSVPDNSWATTAGTWSAPPQGSLGSVGV